MIVKKILVKVVRHPRVYGLACECGVKARHAVPERGRVQGVHHTVVVSRLERKKSGHKRRLGEVQQTGGATVMLHHGQASQVVLQQVGVRHMNVGLAAKNPQGAALEQRPELLVSRKTHQAPRQGAQQGQVGARLTPKSPLIKLRDLVQKLGPAVDMDCFHFSRSVAPMILAT